MESCNPQCAVDKEISVTGITDCTIHPIIFTVTLNTHLEVSRFLLF